MTESSERILNKIAYADGEKRVDEDCLTVFDHGTPYRFGIGAAAYALNAPKDMTPVQGVAYSILGFGTKDEE
jgi:hypothetical protein